MVSSEISASAVKKLRDRTGAGMMDCKRALSEVGGDVDKAVEKLRERGLAKASKRAGRATSEGLVGMALDGASGALVELGCETDFVARTEEFQKLVSELAQRVASDPKIDSVDTLSAASLGGKPVSERLTAAIAQVGENVVLSRVARLDVEGAGHVGGYVHAGGKLGVLVALRTAASGDAVEALAKDLAMHVAAADPTPVATDESGIPAELVESERAIYRRQAEQEGKPEKILDRIVDGKLKKFLKEICLVEQPFVKDPDRSVKKFLADSAAQLGEEVSVSGFVRIRLGETNES
jgi:elongation factor Ts